MSIIIDQNTKLIVQGITGREGTFHTEQVSATLTKWNLEGSMAMESPAI